MELVTIQHEVQRTGQEEIILSTGDVFKIETNLAAGGGDEILNFTALRDHAHITIKVIIDEGLPGE